MKVSEIVKPSNLSDFIRLQVSLCMESSLVEDMEGMRFLARLDHQQSHLPGNPVIELLAVYEITRTSATQISFLVTREIEKVIALFDKALSGKDMAQELGVAWVELHKGLSLQPVKISKPWGQEIWHTGIEARGVSQVKSNEGTSPLDWVIAVAPEQIAGAAKKITLLKILDPLPDEVYGDLYFEMHEEKQEVYVVTHVDRQAWPDGEGGIRYGFNQVLRKTFLSDADFRNAYLKAVQDYHKVRQQIDALLDKNRMAEKIGLNDPVMPEKIRQWQKSFPKELMETEKQLREKMEDFIAVKSLQIGDVVKVPCFTPHSLQHGVRTVEFQTPVYERKILSFAQKVLTQSHWDTESALDKMQMDIPAEQDLRILERTSAVLREEIVHFTDFSVERITLEKNARLTLPDGKYRLLFVVTGELVIGDVSQLAEEARLIPACSEALLYARSEQTVLLLAVPL